MKPTHPTVAFTPQCVIHWFRRDLRLHDNAALHASLSYSVSNNLPLLPIFQFDPYLHSASHCAPARLNFILQSLRRLSHNLHHVHNLPSVHCLYNNNNDINNNNFAHFAASVSAKAVFVQCEYDERSRAVENNVFNALQQVGIQMIAHHGFMLYKSPQHLLTHCSDSRSLAPANMNAFLKLVDGLPVDKPVPFDNELASKAAALRMEADGFEPVNVPASMDVVRDKDGFQPVTDEDKKDMREFNEHKQTSRARPRIIGGEDEALDQLNEFVKRDDGRAIRMFSKPETAPSDFEPRSTTGLSAHLALGTLSPRTLFHSIPKPIAKNQQIQTTLKGQLLWREHFWLLCYTTPNFERMKGNKLCRQIDWDQNEEFIAAWTNGRTGYPWIDALMNQLRTEGFVHHLGRHAVACFLTRGDLWQSWQVGRDVFRKYLIDHDHALNAANWMWLSCSAFFNMYYRVYSPVAFAKKWKGYEKFIGEYAPRSKGCVQPWQSLAAFKGKSSGGKYPKRIVVHEDVVKVNIERMKQEFSKSSKTSLKSKSKSESDRAGKSRRTR